MAFLLGLAVAFLKALATSAGTAAGPRLVEAIWPTFQASGGQALLHRLQTSPSETEELRAREILVRGMESDPGLRLKVQTTLETFAPEYASWAQEIAARLKGYQDAMYASEQQMFGWTEQQTEFMKTNTCPVGHEPFILAEYRDGAGKPASGLMFQEYMDMSGNSIRRESVIAKCPQGHTWPVFAGSNV